MVMLQESHGYGFDPFRDSGGEHEALQVLKACTLNRIDNESDVLFETKVKHLISLIKNSILECREVKILAFDMVNDAPTSTDEDINAASELVRLLIDVAATIDS